MQVDLHYKDGLPYGLREVFHLRKNIIVEDIVSYFHVPGVFIFGAIGGYLGIKGYLGGEQEEDFIHGIGYGVLAALSGMAISGTLGAFIFAPRHITNLWRRNAAFIEHYSEHLDSFVQTETLPGHLDALLEDGLRIDALPHHVINFNVGSLERTLAGISNSYKLIPGLFSSDRQDTPRLLGYQYLAELLSDSDVKPEQFVSVFSPERPLPDAWPVWVGGNRLVRLYHEKKRYDDEVAFRKLSRFQYNYFGPTPNT